MDIYYLGHASFLIKGKNASVITDPFPSSIGIKFPKVSADIVTVSHQHDDHNNVSAIEGVKLVIDGPGEYESQGVSIIGIGAYHDDKKGQLRGRNNIYVIEIDGLRLGHFGDIGHKLNEKILGDIGDLDAAMIPVGGEYTIDAEIASEMARSIGARVTIPMHYQVSGLKQDVFGKLVGVDEFIKKVGLPVENDKKITLRADLESEDQSVVVLSPK